jgi:hypothetical protein
VLPSWERPFSFSSLLDKPCPAKRPPRIITSAVEQQRSARQQFHDNVIIHRRSLKQWILDWGIK